MDESEADETAGDGQSKDAQRVRKSSSFAPLFHALGDEVLQIEKAWHETFQDRPEASSNLESQPSLC